MGCPVRASPQDWLSWFKGSPPPIMPRVKDIYCVEDYLEGQFVKVNSNNGFVARLHRMVGGLPDYDFAVAEAFSHWTWHSTNGRLLVCDLQGVQNAETDLQGVQNCETWR